MKKIYLLLFFGLIIFRTFSQNYTITTGLPNNIISGSGTTISGLGDDNWVGPFNIGFNFPFFNTNQTQFYMAANGSISFNSGDGSIVGTIPSTSTPNNFIAFASTDQYPGASSSPILNYFISGSSPNRILVINYQNIKHYRNSSITSVQLQLFEGSGKIEIHNIQNNSSGYSRTIGIENSTGSIGFSPSGMNNSSSINLSNQMIRFSTCTPPPAPTISPSSAPTICSSSPSTTLTATCSVGTLSWSTGATTSEVTVSPTQTTTYTATCLDNSCQTSANITVPVLQTPSVSPNGTNYICTGNSITLTASSTTSGVSFQWYKDGSSVQNATNATISVNSAGSYSVIVTKDGCTATSPSTVINENSTIPNAPVISPETSFTCPNSNVSLTATGCLGTVVWSNGSTGSSLIVNVASSSTYTAICRVDGCNSINSNVATVNIASVAILAPNGTQICPSNTTLLQSTTSPSSGLGYQWLLNGNPILNANSATYNAGSIGSYVLRITLPNGCTVISNGLNVNVTYAVVPTIAICDGSLPNSPVTRVWDKALGGSGSDQMKTMVQTNDNGYIIVGTSTSGISGDKSSAANGTNNVDLWVIKTDDKGNKIWDKSFGGFNNDVPSKIIQANDGNFIIAGLQSNNSSASSYWVIKIDVSGNLLWQKTFSGSVNNYGLNNDLNDIILLTDGYLLGGSSSGDSNTDKTDNSKGVTDYWVIKIDLNGNKIWDKTYGGSSYDYLKSMTKTNDNGFILAGHSQSPASGDKSQALIGQADYWIIKIDATGNKIWDRSFGALDFEDLAKVLNSSDGGFLLTGTSDSGQNNDKSQLSKGGNDFWIVKTDANGNKLWDKTLGGSDYEFLTDATALTDGYILSGTTYSGQSGDVSQPTKGSTDYWLLKIDLNGNKVWDKRFGTPSVDQPNCLLKIDDNNFVIGGYSAGENGDRTVTNDYSSADIWFLKLKTCEAKTSPITINGGSSVELIASGCPGVMTWNTGQTTGIINVNPTQNTNYSVSCISNNNCTTQANVQVNVNCSNNFIVSAQGNNLNPVVCNTSPSVILEASGCSGNVTWSNGSSNSSIIISPTATGTYSATCSGTSCTPVTKTIQVTYITNPVITAAGNTTVCIGTTVNLTATTNVTGGTLQWYLDGNSIGGANALTYPATTTGAYSFKVLKDGCEAVSNTINITVNTVVPPKPTLTASSLYACGRGYPITLTVSGCNGTVNWYNSNTNIAFWNGTPSGTTASAGINGEVKFYVSCTENVCTSVVSDTVLADFARVSVSSNDNLICNGGSLTLVASPYPNTNITAYSWGNTSTTSNTKVITSAGTYGVSVTYSNGCQIHSYQSGGADAVITSIGNLPNPNIVVTNNSQSGPAVKVWDKRYGGNDTEYISSMLKISNNSYLLGGRSRSYLIGGDKTQTSRGQDDYWIVKIDSSGNKIWDKRFGGGSYDYLNDIKQTTNKDILMFGTSQSGIGGDKTMNINYDQYFNIYSDIWVVKTDSSGNKIWDKKFGGNSYETINHVLQLPDNQFIMAGSTQSGISSEVTESSRGVEDFWIVKIDSAGTKLWDKRFGGNGSEKIQKIVNTNDGNIILAGHSASGISGDKTQAQIGFTDLWIVKITPNGSKIWDKSFGTIDSEYLTDIKIDNENNIIVTATDFGSKSYLYKLNSTGNVTWSKTFNNTYQIGNLQANNKGILFSGQYYPYYTGSFFTSTPRGNSDAYVAQLDSSGNKIWDKLLGSTNADAFYDYLQVDKGLLLGGYSDSPVAFEKSQISRGSTDFWLMKVNLNQEITQPASVNSGQSINLIANNCPGTVIWSGGTSATGAMVSVSPTVPTTYTATCNAYGCSTSSNILISINCSSNFIANAKDGIGATITNPTVCTESPSVNLEATGCLGIISWSNGTTGSAITVSPTGNTIYTATCSDAGCTSVTSTVQVKTFEIPTIISNGPATVCVGNTVQLNAIATGTGYSYQWSKDGVAYTNPNQTSSFTATVTGSYQVTISKNGCSAISTAFVVYINTTIPAAPTFTSDSVMACFGTTVQLTANGCNNGLVTWSNGTTGSSFAYTFNFTNSPIFFTATCKIDGCTSAVSNNLNIVPASSNILNNSIEYICSGSFVTLRGKVQNGATYQWESVSVVNTALPVLQTYTTGYYFLRTIYNSNCSVLSSPVLIESTTILPISTSVTTTENDTLFKVWDRVFGGTNNDSPRSMHKTSDGNYLVFGNTSSRQYSGDKKAVYLGNSDIWVIKLDQNGNKIWEKTFGGSNSDGVSKVLKTFDNNFVIIGGTSSTNGDVTPLSFGGKDIWILKIDENGNKIWDKTVGTSLNDNCYDAIILPDNSFVIAGDQTTLNFDNENYQIIKINSNGNVVWQKIYTGNAYDRAQGINTTNDNGFLVNGYSNSTVSNDKTSDSQGGYDFWVLKLDQNGDKLWDKTFGGNGSDTGHDIVKSNDNNYYLTGYSSSNISGNKTQNTKGMDDFWVVKIDENGNVIWDKSLGGTERDTYQSAIKTNDDGIILGGYIYSNKNGDVSEPRLTNSNMSVEDMWLVKLDLNGNKVWDKRIGGNKSDFPSSFYIENDDLYILSYSNSNIGYDKTFLSWNEEFCTSINCYSDIWLLKYKLKNPVSTPVAANNGQNITLVASNCQGNVTWSNGMSGAEISVSPTTNTTYTATCSAFGCTTTSNIQININPCGQVVSLTQTENISTGTSEAPITIKAQDSINATNTIGQPPTNASAKYAAGKSINLNPGFKVEIGSIFQAKISATPCNE